MAFAEDKIDVLKKMSSTAQAEEIQTEIYNIGMSLEFENLKDWFSGFYEVILGQKQDTCILKRSKIRL